jgi:hypothetical protein
MISGRSPAKFNWGNQSSMIAMLPVDPTVTKEPRGNPAKWMDQMATFTTYHVFNPMWRAKNRKTGEIKWSGTIMIAGNSSYQGVLWEAPAGKTPSALEQGEAVLR